MKKYSFVILLVVIAISSCNLKKSKGDEMRRFTFAATNALNDSILFKNISSNTKLKQVLTQYGVINYNHCTSDSISYLVLDMQESYNLEQTQEALSSLSEKYPILKRFSSIINGDYKLLNRIYKLEQENEYKAEAGQLIPMERTKAARFVLTLEIINNKNLANDYIQVHGIGKAWPEITQNMKIVGIHEMEIYLMGYRAFLIMDTKSNFDWDVDGEKWGTLPREKEWQSYVAKFQKTDPDSKAAEKWKTMRAIVMQP